MRRVRSGSAQRPEPRVLDTFWTVPNIITLGRFLLVPVFFVLMVQQRFGLALVVLAVLGSTDWIDGWVARRFNQVSKAGKILDPLADRLALIIVAIAFVASGIAPLWLILSILIPDVVLIVVSLTLFHNHPDLPVSKLGKLRTAVLLVGAPLLLLGQLGPLRDGPISTIALVLLAVGCICHVIAATGYLIAMFRKAGGQRKVADAA